MTHFLHLHENSAALGSLKNNGKRLTLQTLHEWRPDPVLLDVNPRGCGLQVGHTTLQQGKQQWSG
jgi:hypothetical protein